MLVIAAFANILAFQAFDRLETLGYKRRWWKLEDFKLYRLYWQLAPKYGWPRWPILIAGCCFAIGAVVFVALVSR